MLDEIVTVIPFRDRYFVIYKSGRVLEMILHYSDAYDIIDATFRRPAFEIPRIIP